MNPKDQEMFDRIVALDPAAMTENDIAVLQARRDYLTGQQKQYFKEVLSRNLIAEDGPEAPEKTPAKKEAAPKAPVENTNLDEELENK